MLEDLSVTLVITIGAIQPVLGKCLIVILLRIQQNHGLRIPGDLIWKRAVHQTGILLQQDFLKGVTKMNRQVVLAGT